MIPESIVFLFFSYSYLLGVMMNIFHSIRFLLKCHFFLCTKQQVFFLLLSLLSYPYSYLFTFLPSPVLQSIVLAPNYSFWPVFPPSSTLHPIFPQPVTTLALPPTHSTHWLAYCTNYTQPPPSAILDTSTLHYNNRNTPKHTQRPQTPAALFPLPLLVPPLPIPQNL
jgi:hypothetical protein